MRKILFLVFFVMVWTTGRVSAQEPEVEIIPLAPLIVEAARDPQARGTFYRKAVTVDYRGGRVLLSSNPQGDGLLRTDDLVVITVTHADGSSKAFSHDFRTPDRCYVGESRAVDVSHLFARGRNVVTIELKDLTPPVYSSRPYYLVLLVPIEPTPTSSPEPTPTTSPSPFPSSTPRPTPMVTAVPEVPEQAQRSPCFLALGLLPLLAVAILWRLRNRVLLPGTLDLYEQDRWVQTFVLADMGKKVTLGGQGDILVDSPSPEIAYISARRSDQGVEAVIGALDQEHPIQVGGETVTGSHPLKHGDEIKIGKHTLRYSFFDEALSGISMDE
jgi:hypothetical protein